MRRVWGALCSVFILASVGSAATEDPGYFLSWKQKKELIGLGCMQDSAGVWYDVWICPGYVKPAQSAGEHFEEAGGNFHEYLEADKYRSLKKGSRACFEWAFKDCGADFIIEGIPRAWNRYFSVAHERTQRRVFGWWLAYPWALMESTADMAFRGVVGSSGVAAGVACGTAVVPAYHALDSAVAGTWNLGAGTVVLPACAMTWNTVVSPPLALVGQKPATSRVDGFWVTMVDSVPRKLSEDEITQLGKLGQQLLAEAGPYEQRMTEINAGARENEGRIRQELQNARSDADRKRRELNEEKLAHIRLVVEQSDPSVIPEYSAGDVSDNSGDIRRYLQAQNVPDADIWKIISLLKSGGLSQDRKAAARGKTDPLLRGAEIVGESAEDMLNQ